MFDVDGVLKDFGLTPEKYESLLQDCSAIVSHTTDKTWDDISKKYDIGWNGDSIRKACQPVLVGSAFVKQYFEEKNPVSSPSLFGDQKRELERLKIKYRDERNAWQKQNYNNARFEETMELLEKAFKDTADRIYLNIEEKDKGESDQDETMVVCLSDLHLGETFYTWMRQYDVDIAHERMEKYLERVIEIGHKNNVSRVIVCSLGDQISGNIHKTIAISNKENVIDQVKYAVDLISAFCYELCKEFDNVELYTVAGNHSRLDKKEDAVHDERLDDLIGWMVCRLLQNVSNFEGFKGLDIGVNVFTVATKVYALVHGDYDLMDKKGLFSLSSCLGFTPYAVISGHQHTSAYNNVGKVKIIQSGSLVGSGNDYTIEKRLAGVPSQTVLICGDKGVDCIYDVQFE